ncbi:hypothetical protein [Umezawaea sp. Da 62-37]|uniref:hypothetical protein n=1 Tax=Umezawaea sp. Da 62-37 TaxID=3075927 RepID=UPI0028F72BE1|nr:hypothetical protein [Umezawaea sp. Da 62-37]WNV89416.1 hypothetical protein RM788_14255 [Umezawaea sp. Da 62-37]
MNPAGMNRRLVGAVALALGAIATVGGVLLPLYTEVRTGAAQQATLVVTALGSTLTPGVTASTPVFAVPLVLAALLLLLAAVMVFRGPSPVGRLTAVAGAAVLLGVAWSVYLFVTNTAAVAVVSVPPGGQLVQTLDLGLFLLGGGWFVGTLGAVLVQELPEEDDRSQWRDLEERADRIRDRVREPEPEPEPAPRRRRRHAVDERSREERPRERERERPRERSRERVEDVGEAVVYQLPDAPTDDLDTPAFGFPPAEYGPQGPEDDPDEASTRVTLDPVDPPGRS